MAAIIRKNLFRNNLVKLIKWNPHSPIKKKSFYTISQIMKMLTLLDHVTCDVTSQTRSICSSQSIPRIYEYLNDHVINFKLPQFQSVDLEGTGVK